MFAAGNDGEIGLETVTTPAGAKNILSVGASMTPNSSDVLLDSSKKLFNVHVEDEHFVHLNIITLQASDFGIDWDSNDIDYTSSAYNVVLAEPEDGCTSLTNSISNSIVLIKRGTCYFDVKARNAYLAGAKGVLIYNYEDGYKVHMAEYDSYEIKIAVGSIMYRDGIILKVLINSDAGVCQIFKVPTTRSRFGLR